MLEGGVQVKVIPNVNTVKCESAEREKRFVPFQSLDYHGQCHVSALALLGKSAAALLSYCFHSGTLWESATNDDDKVASVLSYVTGSSSHVLHPCGLRCFLLFPLPSHRLPGPQKTARITLPTRSAIIASNR